MRPLFLHFLLSSVILAYTSTIRQDAVPVTHVCVHVSPSFGLPATWIEMLSAKPSLFFVLQLLYFIFGELWSMALASAKQTCCFSVHLNGLHSDGVFFSFAFSLRSSTYRYSGGSMVKLKFKSTCKSFKNKYFMHLCETICIRAKANFRFWPRFRFHFFFPFVFASWTLLVS